MITPAIGTNELYRHINTLLQSDTPFFIHGSPGIGKSYIVNDIAKQNSLEIIDVRLSQLDAIDLRGIPTISNNQTKWMPPVFLPTDENSEGILFLDELNSAPLSVQAAIYQLVLDRKIGEYTMPKKWRIVCAGNKIDDKGIVFKLPSPLINRMVHIVLEASYEDFKVWAIKNSIHSFIIGFLGFRPDLLSSEVPSSSETNPAFCTPRAWSMLSNIITSCSDINSIYPIIYGCVGYGAGIEFVSFIKVYKTLPNVDAILNESDYESVPTEPSALYALCAALIEKYENSSQARNLFNYSKKLPVEFAVMLIKDLIIKDEDIAELEEFDEWMSRYGEYII
ncbi:MAG: MoxR family ATPase [Campylobacterota bacterium]|nr:MoxR family ATPase [Campylobacterota bacterium]